MKKTLIIFALLALVFSAFYFFSGDRDGATTQNNMDNNQIIMETNFGNITIELFSEKAPKTVENFLKLAEAGFYDGTRFHRIIEDFMIQGGDPLSKDTGQPFRWGTGGPGYTFEDEQNDELLVRGVVAMANSGPNTNGSQFFIITAEETPWLQGKHTAFAKVVDGMDLVMEIQSVATGENDRPVEDVMLQSIKLE